MLSFFGLKDWNDWNHFSFLVEQPGHLCKVGGDRPLLQEDSDAL